MASSYENQGKKVLVGMVFGHPDYTLLKCIAKISEKITLIPRDHK